MLAFFTCAHTRLCVCVSGCISLQQSVFYTYESLNKGRQYGCESSLTASFCHFASFTKERYKFPKWITVALCSRWISWYDVLLACTLSGYIYNTAAALWCGITRPTICVRVVYIYILCRWATQRNRIFNNEFPCLFALGNCTFPSRCVFFRQLASYELKLAVLFQESGKLAKKN